MLQFIHSNEYVHADISTENVYIKSGQLSQVRNVHTVSNMCFFSSVLSEYCPFSLNFCFLKYYSGFVLSVIVMLAPLRQASVL